MLFEKTMPGIPECRQLQNGVLQGLTHLYDGCNLSSPMMPSASRMKKFVGQAGINAPKTKLKYQCRPLDSLSVAAPGCRITDYSNEFLRSKTLIVNFDVSYKYTGVRTDQKSLFDVTCTRCRAFFSFIAC